MNVLSVIGTRPQFIRLAHFHKEFSKHDLNHIIVDTSQHYDANLSTDFIVASGIPISERLTKPQGISQVLRFSHMLTNLELKFRDYNNLDGVIVYGDTDSTLVGAIWAKRNGIPLIHVESGLRSGNRFMPEEVNRVIVDHLSDLLLAPTLHALANLREEGLEELTVVVGDILLDGLDDFKFELTSSKAHDFWANLGTRSPEKYFLCTLHRAELLNSQENLSRVLMDLNRTTTPLVLVQHPRLRDKIAMFGIRIDNPLVKISDPLSHDLLLDLIWNSSGVITDSGGLQREAAHLGLPTLIIRKETEWVELLSLDNVMLSTDTYAWESNLDSLPRKPRYVSTAQTAASVSIETIRGFLAKQRKVT